MASSNDDELSWSEYDTGLYVYCDECGNDITLAHQTEHKGKLLCDSCLGDVTE